MKFGALPERLLTEVDLSLPPEPPFNNDALSGTRVASPKVYVGGAVWGHASWSGKVYPPKTPAAQFRAVYPSYFNAIELNATHYNIYPPSVMQSWAASADEKDFLFCPKFPQQISHAPFINNTGALTDAFLESVSALGEHLGPMFLQMSETFSPQEAEGLFEYLSTLPKDRLFFLELRHPEWFTTHVKAHLFSSLRRMNIGAVITDAPGRRDVAHMHLPLPKVFIRFVCNGLHPTSYQRIDAWVERIAYWMENGLDSLYLFVHPGNDAVVPELINYWIDGLNKHCHLQLRKPEPVQKSLFN